MDEIFELLRKANVKALLQVHTFVIEELRERNIVRSSNAPLGDYTEHVFKKAFGWSLENNAASGHDAVDTESGSRYQIKGRRITANNPSRQLSFLRRLPERKFDFLAAALFNADYSIYKAALVPHVLLEPRSRFSRSTNAWLFKLEDVVWTLPDVRDVTSELTRIMQRPRRFWAWRPANRVS